jgi:PEP-CTERM motif
LIDPNSGWTVTRATDINDLGQIGAFGIDSLDVMHALLLTPTVPVDAARLAAADSDFLAASSATSTVSELASPLAVPEPSVLALFGLVTAGLAAGRVHRLRRSCDAR